MRPDVQYCDHRSDRIRVAGGDNAHGIARLHVYAFQICGQFARAISELLVGPFTPGGGVAKSHSGMGTEVQGNREEALVYEPDVIKHSEDKTFSLPTIDASCPLGAGFKASLVAIVYYSRRVAEPA